VTITIDEVQSKLRDLIHRVVPGEEVVVTLPGGMADGGTVTVDALTVGVSAP
jgi:hypothetical protein